MSLHSGNKISKWYLIGAFGQGGASTLAFCNFALVVSRSIHDPQKVAFTVVRVLKLSKLYKEDCYAYLALNDSVPSVEEMEQLTLYGGEEKCSQFHNGTLVRHVCYDLPNLDGTLNPTPGNLYHFLHASMFDPLLPFRIIDRRKADARKDERATGSRNRLLQLVKEKGAARQSSGSEIRHYRSMEYVVPIGSDEPCVGVEYWVVFNYEKRTIGRSTQLMLRSGGSNRLYVQANHPILGTLNGQNQGERTAQMLREIGLPMVARHIVIHVDASNADSTIRRQLFATNREEFKEGAVLSSVLTALRDILKTDSELVAIERELTEKLASKEAESTSTEVKKEVTRLLLEAGYRVKDEGLAPKSGSGDVTKVLSASRGILHPTAEPLATLPYPQVNRFEIVQPEERLDLPINELRSIVVETDADAEFDRRGYIAFRAEPAALEIATRAPLRAGRLRWRVRATPSSAVGDNGKLIATITRPDGTQLTDELPYEIHAAAEEKASGKKGLVPPFEIQGVAPLEDPEKWAAVWPDLGTDDASQLGVAYKPIRTGDKIIVYYSKIFAPFRKQHDALLTTNLSLAALFSNNYQIWIAYHAILQENSKAALNEEKEQEYFEKLQEEDRVRVAQMQVKEAVRMADLQHRLLREHAAVAAEV